MARISAETIEEINSRTDMVALVGEYVRLERRGHDWWGCCPFHSEKTPSFHVVPDRKMYHCFGCGQGGGLINFYMEMEKVTFAEAAVALAKKAGVEVIYEGGGVPVAQQDGTKDMLIDLYGRVARSYRYFLTDTDMGKHAREYLAQRGVSDDTAEQFCLGYAPEDRRWLKKFLEKKGYSSDFLAKSGLFSRKYPDISFFSDRLVFPICDRKGRAVAFGGRILSGDGPKYLNSGEMLQYKKGETLYAFHLALPEIRSTKSVILCEGYMDVIAYHQAGIKRAVAPLGTAFTEDQARLVRSFADTVYLSFDSDEAGEKATYKAILLCRQAGLTVKIIRIIGGKDPADILLNYGSETLNKAVGNAIIDMDYLTDLFSGKYPVDTAEGKTKASLALFPYIDSLDSDIQKEACLEHIAVAYAIKPEALYADFRNRDGAHKRVADRNAGPSDTVRLVRRNAELRAVLAIMVNFQYFNLMRAELEPDDFDDPDARSLFITLEECYRDDAVSYDSILSRCTDDGIRRLVAETVTSGEFAENSRKTIEDSVRLIKRSSLERRRERLVNKIRQHTETTLEDRQNLEVMITEKMNIDAELSKIKDANE